jgi:hypothetical protein
MFGITPRIMPEFSDAFVRPYIEIERVSNNSLNVNWNNVTVKRNGLPTENVTRFVAGDRIVGIGGVELFDNEGRYIFGADVIGVNPNDPGGDPIVAGVRSRVPSIAPLEQIVLYYGAGSGFSNQVFEMELLRPLSAGGFDRITVTFNDIFLQQKIPFLA